MAEQRTGGDRSGAPAPSAEVPPPGSAEVPPPERPALAVAGVRIRDTFAEAFRMWAARAIVTARDPAWAQEAARCLTGFATSVIGCKVEAGVEAVLAAGQTPDGRPGVSVLLFAFDAEGLGKRLVERVGQTVLTCPTTACFDGLPGAMRCARHRRLHRRRLQPRLRQRCPAPSFRLRSRNRRRPRLQRKLHRAMCRNPGRPRPNAEVPPGGRRQTSRWRQLRPAHRSGESWQRTSMETSAAQRA